MEAERIMVIIAVVMAAVAVAELIVMILQVRLARQLREDLSQVQRDLEEKATKAAMGKLKQDILPTVQRIVPRVLQEMAAQYANQRPADQRRSSGADSQ